MNTLHQLIAAAGLGVAALVPVHAQSAATAAAQSAAPATTPTAGATAAAPAADFTEAEVRKVDKDSKKITLKHGEIKNLDMPPMTMVFQVSDPALLEKVKAGDKVRFAATGSGGKYTVTQLQPAAAK